MTTEENDTITRSTGMAPSMLISNTGTFRLWLMNEIIAIEKHSAQCKMTLDDHEKRLTGMESMVKKAVLVAILIAAPAGGVASKLFEAVRAVFLAGG